MSGSGSWERDGKESRQDFGDEGEKFCKYQGTHDRQGRDRTVRVSSSLPPKRGRLESAGT